MLEGVEPIGRGRGLPQRGVAYLLGLFLAIFLLPPLLLLFLFRCRFGRLLTSWLLPFRLGGGGGLKGGGDPQRDPRNEGGDPKKPHRDPMGPRDPMRTPKLNLWGQRPQKTPWGPPN